MSRRWSVGIALAVIFTVSPVVASDPVSDLAHLRAIGAYSSAAHLRDLGAPETVPAYGTVWEQRLLAIDLTLRNSSAAD